jgi:aspartyl-tRNA(Asn)/glutamyl-tRNA(Gln) amidotransferase subunit A
MSPDDLMFESAVALGRHIQAGEVSSVELTEAYLARIERLNPKLEAFVTVTAERALAEADKADAEMAAGQPRSPLHGVPYCLKDIIQTEGIRTTVGSLILADWVPEHDATIVTRLGEAGAVLLGKANTHEFAFGATTQNVHGRTRNPWDLSRIPGGS